MSDSPVEEIKNRLDIVDVVREYVNLEKAGSNYRAPCPFHAEKSPSFFVNPSRQMWRCFGGCNDGGDMFSFVMRIEGVEFSDALRMLAKKAGVELRRQDPKEETKKKRLSDICELSTMFFEKQMQSSSKGKKGVEYLKERGIREDVIKEWRIGYAPTAKSALSQFLIGEGYKTEELLEAGVSVGKGKQPFDRFSGRLMFPIFSVSGQVVGFGGRVFLENDDRAKYINSPATILYDKSSVLYGIHRAKVGIRRSNFAVVVEGYTDVILSHREGYDNVVSSSGTALTKEQLRVLRRYTDTLLTAFDMDSAGGSATEKGVDLARKEGFDVKVIIMPEKMDPADVILENPEKWQELVDEAQPVMHFYFRNAFSLHDKQDARGKRKIAEKLLPEIKKVENSIERAHYISELANELSVSEEVLTGELSGIKSESQEKREILQKEKKTKREVLEEKVASLCVKNEEVLSKLKKKDFSLLSSKMSSFLLVLYEKKPEKDLSEEQKSLLSYFSALPDYGEDIDVEKEVKHCLNEIKKMNIRDKLSEIGEKIKIAEQKGEPEKEEKLIKEFQKYSKELQNL